MAGGAPKGDGEIGDINVTPLVDIMLVLIIILMVSAEFTKHKTVPVQLPKVDAQAMKKEPIKVALTVKADGLYWQDKKMPKGELPARLGAWKKKHGTKGAVILRSKGDTKYDDLLEVLDQVKLAGISKVGLAVDAN